jgi:hypothetical protein
MVDVSVFRMRATFSRRTAFLLLVSLFAAGGAYAQGGPPMMTDDPGTPGPNKWEVNVGWTEQRTPGAVLDGAPLLDANYGVGDRIELTYYASWNVLRNAGLPAVSGMSESELSAKYRYYDGGDQGLQLSVYPTVNFLTPGTHSDERGLAEGTTSYYLPFEAQRDFKWLSVDAEVGHTFSSDRELQGWAGGLCVGRNVVKGWELDAEIHADADERMSRAEWMVNLGSRIDVVDHVTILLAFGRDLSNTLGPKISLLSWIGVQLTN